METLKESVSWNKDALKDWEEFLARGEETNTLIQTYSFQDAAKFKVKYFVNYIFILNISVLLILKYQIGNGQPARQTAVGSRQVTQRSSYKIRFSKINFKYTF